MKAIQLLKQALPYIRRHKGQVFVIKLGGEIVARPGRLASLSEDISLLTHVGIRVVLVHGGGPQASELSRRLGHEPRLVEGRRVTDEATLDVAKMVFAGKLNTDILSALRAAGVRAVGLSGVDADILHAVRRLPVEMRDEATGGTSTVDFGHVGDITHIDTGVLSLLMDNGYVPVLSSLGSDASGNILNINGDTVASAIARDLAAAKLITLTSAPGVLSDPADPSSLVAALSVTEARAAMSGGSIQGGMRPKLLSLVEAVEGGVERGHILSGFDDGVLLLELFTKRGVGTLIARDTPRADPADAAAPNASAAGAELAGEHEA